MASANGLSVKSGKPTSFNFGAGPSTPVYTGVSQPGLDYLNGAPFSFVPGQVQGAATTTGAGGGGTANDEDAAYWQDIVNQLAGQLGQTQTAAQQGQTSLLDTFNRSKGRLNEDYGKTQRDIGIRQNTLDTNRRTTVNEINRGAATSARSLLGLLAARGSGVSSASMFAIPTAISAYYGGQRGKALTNYGQQQQALDISKDDAEDQYTRGSEDLDIQRKEKERSLREGSLSTENDILGRLTDAATKLKLAQGGTYTGGAEARRPFMERINANNARISQLFNDFRTPSYGVAGINVETPDITNYTTDPLALELSGGGMPVDTPGTYLPFFQRNKKDNKRLALAA